MFSFLKLIFTRNILIFLFLLLSFLILLAVIYPARVNYKERTENNIIKGNMHILENLMKDCLFIKISNSSNLDSRTLYPKNFYFDEICKKNLNKNILGSIKNKYKNSSKLEDIFTQYETYLKSSNRKVYAGYFLCKPVISSTSGFIDSYNLFYVDVNGDILINKETGDLIFIEVTIS